MKRFVLNSTVAAIALLTASSAFASDYNSGVVTKTPSQGYTDVLTLILLMSKQIMTMQLVHVLVLAITLLLIFVWKPMLKVC